MDHIDIEIREALLDAVQKPAHRVHGKRGKGGTRRVMIAEFDWVFAQVERVNFRDGSRHLISQFISDSVAAGVLTSRLKQS